MTYGPEDLIMLDIPPALFASAHIVGVKDDMVTITFAQDVPEKIDLQTGITYSKYRCVAHLAFSRDMAQRLADNIIRNLEAADGKGEES